MARLSPENVQRAKDIIGLYPQSRSALIPVLHVAQEQDGWLTPDGIAHVAELLDLTPAEVYGTATFYDMLFTHPVGTYLMSVCTNIACLLSGGYELLEHAEQSLGVRPGTTTTDHRFTLEEVECLALCGNAPCLTVNWRFFGDVTPERFDALVADLRSGKLEEEVPPHGTLCRERRKVGLLAGGPRAAGATGEAGRGAGPPAGEKDQRGEVQPPTGDEAVATAAQESAGYLKSPPKSDTAPGDGSSRPQSPGS
jgi:NADH-quinone oxidoreductase subunit E